MTDTSPLSQSVALLARKLRAKDARLATAESCTGGLISGELTSISGSSDWYQGGMVAYSNNYKQQILQVKKQTLLDFGAVSEQVAAEMADGVARLLDANHAIATTGIAGPGGGSEQKPVGTVCFGFYILGAVKVETAVFTGDRSAVRQKAVNFAIKRFVELL